MKLEGDWNWLKVWLTYAFNPIAPNHQAAFGAQLIRDRFTVSTQVYFIDEYKDIQNASRVLGQARLIWNASFGYTPDAERRWTLSVAGTNLVDARFNLTPNSTAAPIDYQNAERIAQRLWLQVHYRFD